MTDITANVIVSMPSQLFTMARSFKAVANGKIYIGKIDTDPVNPENQIQVYVENEDGSHVPVSQPIIINAAGYPVYNGQIAKFVTVQNHSMTVYDAYGSQQFYFPNVLKYDPDQLRQELSKQTDGYFFNLPQGGVLHDAIKYVTPEMYINTSSDITSAIQSAFDNGNVIDMSGRDWTLERTIHVGDGTEIKLGASTITCQLGSKPAFDFRGTDKGLLVTGGKFIGNCSAVFYFQGTTAFPSQSGHYARKIRIYGTDATSDTDEIIDFIYMKDAVRQVFIDSCYAYVKNGITASGKCVEVKVQKSIFNSGTSDQSSSRISLNSPSGASYYNEGWHFSDCTIDGVGKSFNVTDIYSLTINGGFIGGEVAFGQPITTHCREIVLGGGLIMKGRVTFTPTVQYDYRANISPSLMFGNGGVGNVVLNAGASGINVSTKLESSGVSGGTDVIVNEGCSNVNVDLSADNTYERLASFNGYGPRCSALIRNYMGSSHPIYTERPLKIISSPVTDDAGSLQVMSFVNIPAGSYIVGSVMSEVKVTAPKGSRGKISLTISLSGLTGTSSQALIVNIPAGMVTPSGLGWASNVIRPQFAAGIMSIEIPFYTTTDIAESSLSVSNFSGNTAIVGLNSYIGYFLI